MGDLKTEDWERDKLRGADLFERECVDDWTGQTSYYDRNDEVRAVLDDLDTLLAENVRLRAVAEALRAERRILQGPPLPPNTKRSATMRYFDAQQETDAALAALEAP